MDGFTDLEIETAIADNYGLRRLTNQNHFYRRLGIVPAHAMPETVQREIAAQLAIDPHQEVQVELRGDSLCIVIGGKHRVRLFLQIEADDGRTFRADVSTHALQEPTGFDRLKQFRPGIIVQPSRWQSFSLLREADQYIRTKRIPMAVPADRKLTHFWSEPLSLDHLGFAI